MNVEEFNDVQDRYLTPIKQSKFISIFLSSYNLISRDRYCFNSCLGTLRFQMPSRMHGSAISWIVDWTTALRIQGAVQEDGVIFKADITLSGRVGIRQSDDCSLPDT